jgi:chemosensory pili system protein ChpA (sensor histidine kinase/response regulator)
VIRLSALRGEVDMWPPREGTTLDEPPDYDADAAIGPELQDPNAPGSLAPGSSSTPAMALQTGFRTHTAVVAHFDGQDDPLDSHDQLDFDLLPMFLEEGTELMSALGTALRQWLATPGEVAHRAIVLRLLHTIKGSGRLTGAFRLGELAHRMESAMEQLPSQGLSRWQIEQYLVRFDHLQGIFASLAQGSGGEQAASPSGCWDQNSSVPDVASQTSVSPAPQVSRPLPAMLTSWIRVRTSMVERLVDEAGEAGVYRSQLESHLGQMGSALSDLSQTLDRLSLQLRELELQADMRIQSRNPAASDLSQQFDPLEFDRFTRLQEIARMMAEAVGDVSTIRRNVQTVLSASQQDLELQSRQLRELQRDLLRMRLVDFEVIADRLYSVVRQAAKELDKQVTLDLEGGRFELDRSVLERMTPSFEHLLRNAVVHGIESTEERSAAGKPGVGVIKVVVSQEGNDVAIEVSDDGRGLSRDGICRKALSLGLIAQGQELERDAISKLLFCPGFSTASEVTELAGRGIGLDVVLSEVNALGGRIETQSEEGQGTRFKLVLPLTTAVTQVLMFRAGVARFGIPAGLVETVIRVLPKMLESAYADGQLITEQGHSVPFYGSGPLLQIKQDDADPKTKTHPVLILRSAGQGLALHVDEVLGNREVVVKNMGPQLSRLPGLAGITVLPSGETTLIYNPTALAKVYGDAVRKTQAMAPQSDTTASGSQETQAPLILVVDDALTVRRVIQRLLLREGYRVALANDGVHALQVLEQQRPLMVLSDIEMPRMDGFELARSIRSRPEYADLPIVMITSRIAQKHRDHAMSLGVNHYLGKPYSESELLGLIRDHVQAIGNAVELHPSLNV